MKPIPGVSDHPAYTVEEPGDEYLSLLGAAREVAAQIVRTTADGLGGAAEYIHRASQELVTAVAERDDEPPAAGGAIFECLQRLLAVWPDIAARRIEGEQVFSGEPALWKRAMTEWPGAFSAEFRRMLEYGRDAARERLTKAERVIESAAFEIRRVLREVDLIVSPTTPQPAFPFDGPVPVDQADLTAIASFGGCPAVSIPCGLTRTGLPMGLQLIGRPLGERALLAAASVLEARCGFAATPPAGG